MNAYKNHLGFVIVISKFHGLQKEEEQVQAVVDDNKSDEDFDKLKDESKEKDSPKKVKPAVKRTPKV